MLIHGFDFFFRGFHCGNSLLNFESMYVRKGFQSDTGLGIVSMLVPKRRAQKSLNSPFVSGRSSIRSNLKEKRGGNRIRIEYHSHEM
jgi:hypothetical protein